MAEDCSSPQPHHISRQEEQKQKEEQTMSTGLQEGKGKVAVTVLPFTIEADHPRNCDLYIQSIPGCRLRSAIEGMRPIIDTKTGDVRVPLEQAKSLASFPRTPGMQLHVNPAELTYRVSDPLHGNTVLCDRIQRFLKENPGVGKVADKIDGIPPLDGKLDPHRMKTLVREMLWLLNANEAKLVQGRAPDLEDIEELDGKFLLNPGSRVGNTQPVFEEDFPNWVDNLSRTGG